jgi:SAM-dependent methyltransferase
MDLNQNILGHYNLRHESKRLNDFRLEKIRTQIILNRYLPKAPAQVLDVGGAHGIYAFPLAAKGYQVTLIDPVPLHIEQATRANEQANSRLERIQIGDSRDLKFGANEFDAVLFLGPLYHLTDKAERISSIQNARRVLKPNGIFIASYISRFASLIDGVSENRLADDVFAKIVEADLESGQHRNPTNCPEYFTDAYFHHPDDCKNELKEAGFSDVKLINIEGPFWSYPDIEAQMANEKVRSRILKFLDQIECEETLMGTGAHLMTVAVNS